LVLERPRIGEDAAVAEHARAEFGSPLDPADGATGREEISGPPLHAVDALELNPFTPTFENRANLVVATDIGAPIRVREHGTFRRTRHRGNGGRYSGRRVRQFDCCPASDRV